METPPLTDLGTQFDPDTKPGDKDSPTARPADRASEASPHLSQSAEAYALEAGRFGVVLLDQDGRIVHSNSPARKLFCLRQPEAIGPALSELVHVDDRGWVETRLELLLAGAIDRFRRDVRLRTGGEPEVRAELNARPVAFARSPAVRAVVLLQDASDRPRREQELKRLADTDPLTELLNRRSFAAELQRHLIWASRYGARGAVLVIGIDGLKAINDTGGHLAGDRAIVFTANLIRARTRASDVVARIGGGEFAVLLPAATLLEAKVVAGSVFDAVQNQQTDGKPTVTLSVGIAAVESRDELWGVFDCADRAMSDVKRSGGNGYASTGASSLDE